MTLFIFEQSSILEIRMIPQHDPIYIIYLFIYLFIYLLRLFRVVNIEIVR